MSAPLIGEVGDRAELVAEVVRRAVATIPFYAHHLTAAAGRSFADLPTCSKADLGAWGPRPLDGSDRASARYCATSGSTGPRMLVGFSKMDWERLGALLGRRSRQVGLGPGDLLANTHGYGLWVGGPALELMALHGGAAVLPTGPGNTDQLLRWLDELPITAISATPSFLRFLAERVDDTSGWNLRLALAGGEGAAVALRRQVSDALGSLRWQELYGATEVGGPALGWGPPDDPYAGRLLVDTDEFVVELLEVQRDVPVADGELGELTVTTLHRECSPLVRYRTRDLATALPGVHDASGYPSITTVAGRVDDALKVRGALVYPAVVEAVVVEHCPPGAEWRIVVEGAPGQLDTMTVRVEHEPAGGGDLAERLADRLGVRVEVDVVAPGTLARFEGKAARVEDRRA